VSQCHCAAEFLLRRQQKVGNGRVNLIGVLIVCRLCTDSVQNGVPKVYRRMCEYVRYRRCV